MDAAGSAYVTGYTISTNFPTQSPYQATFGRDVRCFRDEIDAGGQRAGLLHLPGWHAEIMAGIAVDAAGSAYVSG